MLFGRRSEDSPCRRHVPPGAPQKLSAGGLTLPEQRRDLPVIEIENVVEEEGGALRMRQPLKRDDERHRNLVQDVDLPDSAFFQVQRFRQSVAAALLASCAGGIELVEAKPGDDLDQVGLRRVDLHAALLPAQPRILHDVLRAAHIAEHPIGERHQRRPVHFEELGVVSHEISIAFT